ncbi:MAG: NAD(P)H-hydrate dehydratase, partial [Chthoniobacteraceae bacterium]
ARHLAESGWDVRLVGAHPDAEWSPLPRAKFGALKGCRFADVEEMDSCKGKPLIVLDGLLGIGAKGALQQPISGLAGAINRLRQSGNAAVFALDLPTGLDGDTGAADPACVVADYTLTIGFAKAGLVADQATAFVGRLCVLPLRELSRRLDAAASSAIPATPATLAGLLPRRPFDSHKGDHGRIGILAGSRGYLGAAVLCSGACVRAGAGLVTLYAAPDVAELLSQKTAPEVMVRAISSPAALLDERHDVFAVGPGLGAQGSAEVARLVGKIERPMVLDADGLNAVAPKVEVLGRMAGELVLTPHPGEMERLAPGSARRTRREVVESFTDRFPCTLLLKGARTLVGKKGEPLGINTTGTPGMAVGGMGDVLTGVIAALIGQRVRPFDAARIGAWLCGRASEIAISDGGESEETLTPSRMLDFLGAAFADLRAGCF